MQRFCQKFTRACGVFAVCALLGIYVSPSVAAVRELPAAGLPHAASPLAPHDSVASMILSLPLPKMILLSMILPYPGFARRTGHSPRLHLHGPLGERALPAFRATVSRSASRSKQE